MTIPGISQDILTWIRLNMTIPGISQDILFCERRKLEEYIKLGFGP